MPYRLDQRRDIPKCYYGPWPPLLLEALAYHETGHAISAIHHGQCVVKMWIADKRGHHQGDDAQVQGATITSLRKFKPRQNKSTAPIVIEAVVKSVFAATWAAIGSPAGELLAPNYEKFDEMHKMYPEFLPNADFFAGSRNDYHQAFVNMAPLYRNCDITMQEINDCFEQEFVIPTEHVLLMYKPQADALAARLMEVRELDGPEVHKILCHTPGHHMPGCKGSVLTAKFKIDLELAEKQLARADAKDIVNVSMANND